MKTNKLIRILILSIILISCSKDDDDSVTPPNASSFSSISELRESLKPDPYVVTVDPTDNFTVDGPDGVQINCGPDSVLDASGQPVTENVEVSLNEYLTTDKMILANAPTTSSGQLLVTGGSFDLKIGEDADEYSLAPWNCNCSFSVQTDPGSYLNQMQLFTGNVVADNNGGETVDWEVNNNVEGGMGADGLFNTWGIDVGLSNCDVLFNMAGANGTQFEATISGVSDYSDDVSIWLVIDDFPSVVMLTTVNSTPALETYQGSIPMGLNGTLIGIHIDEDDYLKFGSLPIEVMGDDSFNIDVDFGTEEDLVALIQSLTN
tara:strand:+ start:57 stop:1013 length:957 start_codon:yes stop_codon:yes gene_type:complete